MMIQEVTFLSNGLRLEGMLHRPAGASLFPAVAVCHPHPLYGGDMGNSVGVAIWQGMAGGVGGGRIGVAGSSFGALVALAAVDERVRGVAAISPPLAMQDLSSWKLRCPSLFVFGGGDALAPPARPPG